MFRSLYWGRSGSAGAPASRPADPPHLGPDAGFSRPLRSDGERACASDWRAWKRSDGLIWFDLERPDRALMERVAEMFDLHRVAVNAVMAPRARPKLLTFDRYLLLTLYGPQPLPVTSARLAREAPLDRVDAVELIVGDRFLLTVRDAPLAGLESVWREHAHDEVPPVDMSDVVHELMDDVVDLFFPVLDAMVDRVEEIQDTAFVGAGEQVDQAKVAELFSLKKQLTHLHRILTPQRNAIAVLAREELPYFRTEGAAFQDIFDHATRQAENVAVYVDLLVSARDAYVVRVSNALTRSAKVLLALSLFLTIPAFVFAVYGMRFDGMPELAWPIGAATPLLIVLAADTALFIYCQRRLGLFS